jgi:hypothetical protein
MSERVGVTAALITVIDVTIGLGLSFESPLPGYDS